MIKTISNSGSKSIITFDAPLEYKHYSGVETYGGKTLAMRAEVGLITRNVLYQGDEADSEKNRYGAHIMMHSSGDDSLTGRISYCEFKNVGQAF